MFQQLLGSKPCPVSIYPAYFRPISPNAVCCIFSRARFVMSKKLPPGVIGRRCAVRKLDSDLYIKDGGCDCPYGRACKYMAALWYAVRAQTPDGQPDESDAQQPKKGGNPYRQQLSRIFSRTRYYDYHEAADLGFSKL